jgi:NADH-quinone oxidoreductase subunit L
MEKNLILIPLLPLIGFLINGIFGKKLPKNLVGALGTLAVFGSFILSLMAFLEVRETGQAFSHTAFTWMQIAGLKFDISFLADQLSTQMMLIITGIGSLIHLYSIGYMHEDEGFYKFFAYLNLFVFSMLLLVMGSNYLLLFFGWEGVGLCSYLLIGFWYQNLEYGKAARKAFVMNRIGDLGLMLGLFMLLQHAGSLEYKEVMASLSTLSTEKAACIGLLLFVGATGKSAQIPLYTWLPDAMAGPTPVSALIHAATMVTAGIYLIVRSSALYSMVPEVLEIIGYIGLATALFAGLIAIRQNDIKKVLAYSTVSQLGFMFVAIGVGAYSTAMFHLTTHAFFKALMFLGSGSVIHAMGGEQDIRKMGGLAKKLKITHLTFLVGTLAIIGFPLTSGFFSKDEILANVYEHSPIMWGLLLLASAITAFYMLRMFFLTFHGSFRGTHDQEHHLHESPISMTLPLMVLAVLSLAGGFLNVPAFISEGSEHLHTWLNSVVTYVSGGHHLDHSTEWLLMGVASALALIILVSTYVVYVSKKSTAAEDDQLTGIQKWMNNKFYIDELYQSVVQKPIEAISNLGYNIIDRGIIDGSVNFIGKSVEVAGNALRRIQNGNVEYYLLYMVLGIFFLLVFKFVL